MFPAQQRPNYLKLNLMWKKRSLFPEETMKIINQTDLDLGKVPLSNRREGGKELSFREGLPGPSTPFLCRGPLPPGHNPRCWECQMLNLSLVNKISNSNPLGFWGVLSASKSHLHSAALLEALSLLWPGALPPSLFLLDILEVWEPRRQGTSFLRV